MSNEAVYHDAPRTTEDYAPKTTNATPRTTEDYAPKTTEDYAPKTTNATTRTTEEYAPKTTTATPRTTEDYGQTTTPVKVEPETIEKQDRGLFDFLGKKKEEEKKCEETPISSEFEQKVDVSEPEPKSEEQQPETLFQKMHISHTDSSSSSDDEECIDGEKKKKKKKPLTEQLKEKIEERKEKKEEEEAKHEDDNRVPIEKYEEVAAPPSYTDVGDHTPTDVVHHETPVTEEKKGFMEKIKEKLPGGNKKPVEEQVVAPPPPTSTPAVVAAHETEGVEQPEKKGILEKIKDKIPGLHSKTEEEKEKEKVKECH